MAYEPPKPDYYRALAAGEGRPKLPAAERRLYLWIGGVAWVLWLTAFAAWIYSRQTLPWIPIAGVAQVVAVRFGVAVRGEGHVWPFRRYFEGRSDTQ